MKKYFLFSVFLFFATNALSQLPDCPPRELYNHNCIGTVNTIFEKFVGEFRYYQRNGQGTSIYPNGDKYVGEFKDNRRNGRGTFTYAVGDSYVGEWVDGKPNGQGTYHFAANNQFKGDTYVGEFKDGKHHGQGTYIFQNGNQHVAEWKEGMPNGNGILYSVNGSIVSQGHWENGKLVQSFELDIQRFPFNPSFVTAGHRGQTTDVQKSNRDRSLMDFESAQAKCKELGFKPKTEGYGKCVLQLSK
jgi:hypothetical protein